MEIVIVATRRPILLEKCLESFSEKVFSHYGASRVIVNIDPIWGDSRDHRKVIRILRYYFDELEILEPAEANFTQAVKRLWQKTESETVLHLEEDWIVLDDIYPETVAKNLSDDVASLSLMSETKNNHKHSRYHFRRYRPWYLPFKIVDKTKPYFSTSPSFWRGDVLRTCGKLLDIKFDPEKQFYSGLNKQLENYVSDKKCKFLFGNPNLVEDIGRAWREERRIRKILSNGMTSWENY